jgi:phage antirepressor YoqD-like protein
MNDDQKEFIKENREKLSMMDIANLLDLSYNRVRNFMIENDLMISPQKVQQIRINKIRKVNRPWNWDALP